MTPYSVASIEQHCSSQFKVRREMRKVLQVMPVTWSTKIKLVLFNPVSLLVVLVVLLTLGLVVVTEFFEPSGLSERVDIAAYCALIVVLAIGYISLSLREGLLSYRQTRQSIERYIARNRGALKRSNYREALWLRRYRLPCPRAGARVALREHRSAIRSSF